MSKQPNTSEAVADHRRHQLEIANGALDSIDNSTQRLLGLSTRQLFDMQLTASGQERANSGHFLRKALTQALLLKANAALEYRHSDKLGIQPYRRDSRVVPAIHDQDMSGLNEAEKTAIIAGLNKMADALGLSDRQREHLITRELETSYLELEVSPCSSGVEDGYGNKTGPVEYAVDALGKRMTSQDTWIPLPERDGPSRGENPRDIRFSRGNDVVGIVNLPEDKQDSPHLAVLIAAMKAQEEIARGGYTIFDPKSSLGVTYL